METFPPVPTVPISEVSVVMIARDIKDREEPKEGIPQKREPIAGEKHLGNMIDVYA